MAELALLQQILSRLSSIEAQLGTSGGGSGGADVVEVPRSIRAFDEYCAAKLDPFVAVCDKLGGDAQAGGQLVKTIWNEIRVFLLRATACKEPAATELRPLLAPIIAAMDGVKKLTKRNEWEKHLKTISEGIAAANWLCVKPAPRDFIETTVGGSDYWANGIRREFKGVNPDQIAFCDTFKSLLQELMPYVKEFHTTGVSWNARGVLVSEYVDGAPAQPAAAAPAPAAAPVAAPEPAKKAAPAPLGNLFAEVSKGGAITAGLKTVTKDMQTWRAEYKSDAPAPVAKAKVAPRNNASVVKGPAKLEFVAAQSKWVVENQTEEAGVINIAIENKSHVVYIYGCCGATIDIKGKCKSIVVDSCKKTRVVFENAMATIEVVNSVRMNVECTEKVASVAIDKTDGIVVTLPRSSLETSIVASKSSEMNVQWRDEEGELVERPIPEQYVHYINAEKKEVSAAVSDLYSH